MPLLAILSLALAGQAAPVHVFPPANLLATPVGGLEATNASAQIVAVQGPAFSKALQVTIRKASAETNATQLQLRNTVPVQKGDALMATFWVKGAAQGGKNPARMEFLFEKATQPWTKSVTHPVMATPNAWRKVMVPFESIDSFPPNEAMVSLRFAFGPQTLAVGGLSLVNHGKAKSLAELTNAALLGSPLGTVALKVDMKDVRQRIRGLGGNFCQPRYGATEPLDAVGRTVLDKLNVVHARIGLPLNNWNPEPGVFKDDAQARASLFALSEFAKRKLPTVVSVWEGPEWMLGPGRETSRTLPKDRYDECVDAIARYLVLARDKYGCHVDYFSFNEPDYGVNFRFTPAQMADFVRLAVPEFQRRGLKTKFLVADTANGTNFYDYAKPLLEDRTLAPYLGPIAFHSWDALGASEIAYRRIAELGRKHKKEVWCLEAGHDAQLWQKPNPWESWENALRNALAYARTVRLTESSLVDYWTYQDNYPLVSKDGKRPFAVFQVMRQMEGVFVPGSRMVGVSDAGDVQAVATIGPAKGRFAVLLANPVGAGKVAISGLPRGARVKGLLSDEKGQNRPVGLWNVDSKGRLTVPMPIRSVVTLVSN